MFKEVRPMFYSTIQIMLQLVIRVGRRHLAYTTCCTYIMITCMPITTPSLPRFWMKRNLGYIGPGQRSWSPDILWTPLAKYLAFEWINVGKNWYRRYRSGDMELLNFQGRHRLNVTTSGVNLVSNETGLATALRWCNLRFHHAIRRGTVATKMYLTPPLRSLLFLS